MAMTAAGAWALSKSYACSQVSNRGEPSCGCGSAMVSDTPSLRVSSVSRVLSCRMRGRERGLDRLAVGDHAQRLPVGQLVPHRAQTTGIARQSLAAPATEMLPGRQA
jgi:hypothetical protein